MAYRGEHGGIDGASAVLGAWIIPPPIRVRLSVPALSISERQRSSWMMALFAFPRLFTSAPPHSAHSLSPVAIFCTFTSTSYETTLFCLETTPGPRPLMGSTVLLSF